MTQVIFQQKSPAGGCTLDSERLLVGTDGQLFLKSTGAPVPLSEEQAAALREHFGSALQIAINAAKALA